MDTFTSFLAGITIFSILGNLAHESGKNVTDVVSAGTGLAFVSYPDAIAKFQYVPQVMEIHFFFYFIFTTTPKLNESYICFKFFAVMFFLMLLTLGIGSAVSLTGCVVTIICDDFPHWKRWLVVTGICLIGFISGLVYVTPVRSHRFPYSIKI
jgi:solute carrier family 6 amino acid transporter-like protein 5/7/9/14